MVGCTWIAMGCRWFMYVDCQCCHGLQYLGSNGLSRVAVRVLLRVVISCRTKVVRRCDKLLYVGCPGFSWMLYVACHGLSWVAKRGLPRIVIGCCTWVAIGSHELLRPVTGCHNILGRRNLNGLPLAPVPTNYYNSLN